MQGHLLKSSRLKSAFLQKTFSNHFPIQSIPVRHFRSRIFFDLFHSPLPRPSILSLHSRSRPSWVWQLLHGPHSLHILDATLVELPHWISFANLQTVQNSRSFLCEIETLGRGIRNSNCGPWFFTNITSETNITTMPRLTTGCNLNTVKYFEYKVVKKIDYKNKPILEIFSLTIFSHWIYKSKGSTGFIKNFLGTRVWPSFKTSSIVSPIHLKTWSFSSTSLLPGINYIPYSHKLWVIIK